MKKLFGSLGKIISSASDDTPATAAPTPDAPEHTSQDSFKPLNMLEARLAYAMSDPQARRGFTEALVTERKPAKPLPSWPSAQSRLPPAPASSPRPHPLAAWPEPAPPPRQRWRRRHVWTVWPVRRVVRCKVKAGLSSGASPGVYVVPPETERAIERRLIAVSPMHEIASVHMAAGGVFMKPVSTAGRWLGAETDAHPETDPATRAPLDDAIVDRDKWSIAFGDSPLGS